jgi:hypothetical protein
MVKRYGTETVGTSSAWSCCAGLYLADDTAEFAREQDAFMERPARSRHWGAVALAAVVGLAGLSYVATVHNSLAAQQQAFATMQQQL